MNQGGGWYIGFGEPRGGMWYIGIGEPRGGGYG